MTDTKTKKKPTNKENKKGYSKEYRARIFQTEDKEWIVEIVSKAGRVNFASTPYKFEKQARRAAARCINSIRAMPPTNSDEIEVRLFYKERESKSKKTTKS